MVAVDPAPTRQADGRTARQAAVTIRMIFYDSGTESVSGRRVTVRCRRDPAQEPGEIPAQLGPAWTWLRTHFRTASLPVRFPEPGEHELRGRTTWARRQSADKREIIRREFAARGYPLPE